MTREEALNKAINIVRYFEANFAKSKEAREDLENIIEALEQEPKTDTWSIKDVANTLAKHGLIAEQEPCEDCISRQAALDTFCLSEKSRKYGGDHSGYDTIMLYEVQDALEALPSVNPQKIGHWIADVDKWGDIVTTVNGYRCNKCNTFNADKDNYCPNCGCHMIETQESEKV